MLTKVVEVEGQPFSLRANDSLVSWNQTAFPQQDGKASPSSDLFRVLWFASRRFVGLCGGHSDTVLSPACSCCSVLLDASYITLVWAGQAACWVWSRLLSSEHVFFPLHGRTLLYRALLCCALPILHFYKLKVCGNAVSSKSFGAIYPTTLCFHGGRYTVGLHVTHTQ